MSGIVRRAGDVIRATDGWEPDSAQTERERYERSMRRMNDYTRWLDDHEHWRLREQRWRDQGRIS